MNNNERQPSYKRSPALEEVLKEVNDSLSPAEANIASSYSEMKWPVVFIVGAPRSGSTLFLQWLAKTGIFSYPTNVLSRFFKAPYLGARVQQMLVDLDAKGEIIPDRTFNFSSNLGKTIGPLAPHEFWYFWRRFFPFEDRHQLTEEELKSFPKKELISELSALEDAFGRPLAMKAMMMNWHIDLLHQLFPKALFIHLRRDSIDNMRSILKARESYFGDKSKWWSFVPREMDKLTHLSPEEQVAAQLQSIYKEVDDHFDRIPLANQLTIDYNTFCSSPERKYSAILNKLSTLGVSIEEKYVGESKFTPSGNPSADDELEAKLQSAFSRASALLNGNKH